MNSLYEDVEKKQSIKVTNNTKKPVHPTEKSETTIDDPQLAYAHKSLSAMGSLIGLTIAGILVVLLPGLFSYLYIHNKKSSAAEPKAVAVVISPTPRSRAIKKIILSPTKSQHLSKKLTKAIATPMPRLTQVPIGISPTVIARQPAVPTQATQPDIPLPTRTLSAEEYTDHMFGYSVQLPSNWIAFQRAADDDTAHQIGLHPAGSSDTPVVINTYKNGDNLSVDEAISSRFGATSRSETENIWKRRCCGNEE